ncbi:MAG: selenocysteine-specific translation elongation factor [bacterium]|nr:selenocysteine-specific translation elongation factor [bacterium]
MKQVVLGTAGHIDHGKTALVKALTGVDTDRLKEEKERGITIDLGFAHLSLGPDIICGVVDVPGHERFVKNMLAGAGGIDLVVLVVAADEGVMPQTREHLAICELLGVSRGIVALTKVDLVEAEWLELVAEEVGAFLEGTFLDGSPIVAVSSVTGQGLEELIQTLTAQAEAVSAKDASGPFRLPIDRVFTMKGFGTVVTGTCTGGRIGDGETVEVYPREVTTRIRGVQVHGLSVDEALAGQRTAINLQAVEKAALERGDVLARPESLHPTTRLVAEFSLLEDAPGPVKHRQRVRCHMGTAEVMGRLVLLEAGEVAPGQTTPVEVRLEKPVAVLPRDRYVVRTYSPIRTIGGGEILDVDPPRLKRLSGLASAAVEQLRAEEPGAVVAHLLERAGTRGLSLQELRQRSPFGHEGIEALLEEMRRAGQVVALDGDARLLHAGRFREAVEGLAKGLEAYHAANPLKAGASVSEVRSMVAEADERVAQAALQSLVDEGRAVVERTLVRLSGHEVTLAADQAERREALEEAARRAGMKSATAEELLDTAGLSPEEGGELIQLLVEEGTLVRLKNKHLFHREALAEAQESLVAYLEEHGEMAPAQFRDLLGITRKIAIPLLEHFDAQRLTLRVGDNRVLRGKG